MWLFIPSLSVPASADSTSELSLPWETFAHSVTLSGKSPQPKSLQRAWKTGRWRLLQFGRTSQPSLEAAFVEWLILLRPDSLAPITPLPEDALDDSESTAKSGITSSESFAKWDRGSASWKTCQASLFPTETTERTRVSDTFWETWPRAGTMRNGCASERPMWVPRIGVSGGSVWPTVVKEQVRSSTRKPGTGGDILAEIATNWPTPDSRDSQAEGLEAGKRRRERYSTQGLQTAAVSQWTTPQANDQAGGNPDRVRRHGTTHGDANLADDVMLWRTPDAPGGGRTQEQASMNKGHQYTIAEQAENLWLKPNVPNGGRCVDAETVANHGMTPEGKRTVGLESQSHHWRLPGAGTPNSLRGSCQSGLDRAAAGHQVNLQDQVGDFLSSLPAPQIETDGPQSSPSSPGLRRRLNPAFVAMLMGLPWWWTRAEPISCARSEMAAYRYKLRALLLSSRGGSE